MWSLIRTRAESESAWGLALALWRPGGTQGFLRRN